MTEYVGEYVVSLTAKTFTDLRSYRHEEIVRCRDCRHFTHADNDWCAIHDHIGWSVNGFCAWGERSEES